jgi:hypothetical protein
MLLGTRNSGFVFQLPESFLNKEQEKYYMKVLKKNHIPYESPIHFLNSTIKSINIPGLSFTPPTQTGAYGKTIHKKPANYTEDLVTTHELNVTFRSVNNDLNWAILFDVLQKKYEQTDEQQYEPSFLLHMLDDYRDVIFTYEFKNILFTSITENLFDYSQQKIQPKEFTATFTFNWWTFKLELEQNKILDNSLRPIIIIKHDKMRRVGN